MFILSKYDLHLLSPTESANDKLGNIAAKIALHNFEWRYITFVMFNSTVLVNGVENFLKLYKKSQIIGKGIFYPSFAEKTRQFVVFGADLDNISRMLKWMTTHQFDNTGKYIAVCQSTVPRDCDETKAVGLFWNYKITNVVFMKIEDDAGVVGYTYFYSSKNCRNGKPVKIKQLPYCNYNNKSSCDEFFPEKFNNLHRCPLIVSTFIQMPYLNITNGIPHGADGDLLLLIAEKMNASLNVMLPRYGNGWGMIESDGQWSGSLRDVLDDVANFSMTSAALTLARFSHFQLSIGYFRVRVGWITHPAKIKPSSLKLFQPFEILSLISLIVSFIIVLLCGYVINNKFNIIQDKSDKELIFYSWMICMGVPSTKLPSKPAFLYMVFLWIWYCFLIRTLYQVYLIGCLQGDFYYDQINTIEEAYMANYTFGGGGALRDYYISYPLIYNNWKNVNATDIVPTLLKFAKGYNFVLAMNLETAKTVTVEQKLFVHILPQKILSSPTVIFFKKFSPLVGSVNTVLWRLIEAGFTDKIYKNHISKLLQSDESPQQAISLEHFTGCYVILLVGWITSTCFFVIEVFFKMIQETVLWKYFSNLLSNSNNLPR